MSSQSKMSTADCSRRRVPGGCWIRLCFQPVVVAFLLSGGVLIFGNLPGKQIDNLTIVKIHFFIVLNVTNFLLLFYSFPYPQYLISIIIQVTDVHYGLFCCTACSMDIQNWSILLWNYCHFLPVLIMRKICIFLYPNDYCGKEITHPSKCCHSGYSLTSQRN